MSKGRTYGMLLFLPLFILSQLFGLGFNLGLLATTLFKVITADIAFGWQSTLQLDPATVYSLVQQIALPWSWFAPVEHAYPSLVQIEGSRIILKEGIYHLSTPALASWWPFLSYSLLFYGLLPRLLLFLAAVLSLRFRLGSLNFRQANCEQLLLRMTTPLISTRGRRVDEGLAPAAEGAPDRDQDQAAAFGLSGKNLIVMIPEDIYEACAEGEIEAAVQNRFASPVQELVRISMDDEADKEVIEKLQSSMDKDTDILLIQEAWQPPIQEYITFIKALRRTIGHGPCIRIGLIGRPLPESIFSPVQNADLKTWVRKTAALGDPCIHTVEMVNYAS